MLFLNGTAEELSSSDRACMCGLCTLPKALPKKLLLGGTVLKEFRATAGEVISESARSFRSSLVPVASVVDSLVSPDSCQKSVVPAGSTDCQMLHIFTSFANMAILYATRTLLM